MLTNANLASFQGMPATKNRPNEPLIARLKIALERSGLSAAAASAKATGSDSTIRQILKGRTYSPRHDTLERIAQVLDVSTMWLAAGEGEIGNWSPSNTQRPFNSHILKQVVADAVRFGKKYGKDYAPEIFAEIVVFSYVKAIRDGHVNFEELDAMLEYLELSGQGENNGNVEAG